jgi:predicted dehydrogenase
MGQAMRLGMVGAGFVAHFHARALMQIRSVEVAGITSRTRASAQELSAMVKANGLGEGVVYSSVAEMAEHVDAIAICAPNFVRVELVEQIVDAVRAGAELKGVICEKPLARNVREARRLVDLAEEAGLRTAYFENQIFMKPVQAQLAQLEPQQRTMGPLALVRSAEEHGGPHEPWFWDPTRQGGGVLCDMGCHSIAAGWYALTPVGRPPTFLEPISVSADCALLKWGLPQWREKLLQEQGVDYENARRGLRDRHGHVPAPRYRSDREGPVHQFVDVREAGAAAPHGWHGSRVRVRDQLAQFAAAGVHR